ncbi:hypothetical protein SDC9_179637 [bioreactor metagenome]|uniref:Uncharacterized protein n=1 Tax=bioreactor metagenome TaxID=1076179 RepID=A0A645GZC2_9ZZZZ
MHTAAVAGRHGVKPAHIAGTPGLGAVFAGVTAALPQLLSLLARQGGDEVAGAHAA